MTGSNLLRTLLAAFVAWGLGCSGPDESEVEAKQPKKSIFKQRTQEVGEFDPNSNKQLSDSKVRVTSPLLAGLENRQLQVRFLQVQLDFPLTSPSNVLQLGPELKGAIGGERLL